MAERESGGLSGPLPWQEELWSRIRTMADAGRLPHAFLMHGPAGLGKVQFARALAESLLCRQADAQGLACGGCDACALLRAGSHPDLHWCETEADESGEREKGSIGIEQIRELCRFLSLTSHRHGRKIAVIRGAHRMNLNSANALLKTLEEPSESSLLILITEFPSRLPATVLSRCQRLRCPPPDPQTASAWLSRHRPEVTNPALLLALTGGSPLAAAELGDGDALTRRDAMLGELTALLRGRADPVDIAAEWLKFGARESLYWLYHWLADIRRIQAGWIPPHLAGSAQEGRARQLGDGFPPEALHRMLQLTERALRLIEGQSNVQLLLEDVLIAWSTTGSTADTAAR